MLEVSASPRLVQPSAHRASAVRGQLRERGGARAAFPGTGTSESSQRDTPLHPTEEFTDRGQEPHRC